MIVNAYWLSRGGSVAKRPMHTDGHFADQDPCILCHTNMAWGEVCEACAKKSGICSPTYAGIGSRETPAHMIDGMDSIGNLLAMLGYTLRSGGAKGADSAFEKGCDRQEGDKEIYLPFDGFLGRHDGFPVDQIMVKQAQLLAAKYHPNWNACGSFARSCHTRNVFQVLGHDLNSYSDFIVCWTSDGDASGGTGQAIRIARAYNIPVYNLQNEECQIDMLRPWKD